MTKHLSSFLPLSLIVVLGTVQPGLSQEEEAIDPKPESSNQRDFNEISPGQSPPSVRFIAPLDNANIMFLDQEGRVGVAKFSPGLSLIGWDFYSSVKQELHPGLVPGKEFSAITASYGELTQAFDTDEDFRLDFFQAVLRKWKGIEEGVVITAGPVSDKDGRVLLALSPFKSEEETVATAKIVAWTPETEEPAVVMVSQLVVGKMALSGDGLIGALLELDNFPDYYVSVTELPPPPPVPDAKPESLPTEGSADTEQNETGEKEESKTEGESEKSEDKSEGETEKEEGQEEAEPEEAPIPGTMASLIIPSELTDGNPPGQLSFFVENGKTKLLLTCPETSRLIEISLEKPGEMWQGPIMVRSVLTSPVETVADMGEGRLLAGGADGFFPGNPEKESFRIREVQMLPDGIALHFTFPVDRATAVQADTFSLKTLPIKGGEELVIEIPEPVVESDGYTVILNTDKLQAGNVLRLKCPDLKSESGDPLINPVVYYGMHGL